MIALLTELQPLLYTSTCRDRNMVATEKRQFLQTVLLPLHHLKTLKLTLALSMFINPISPETAVVGAYLPRPTKYPGIYKIGKRREMIFCTTLFTKSILFVDHLIIIFDPFA
ncbi:hypothetical protein DPMN_001183 [Dreissena polymorpha]|uniref:Uncharacterized protein n=1 Tax=Dreissena polymorpha TaxID=45954 RepID=A0A9D4RSP8_DREPO|nr:hypothetical protein DPMN_001183 [Dreissena polymorpha]